MDRYTVAVVKDKTVVSHVPRKISGTDVLAVFKVW